MCCRDGVDGRHLTRQTRAAAVLHTSNPGTATTTPGGVGRNVAESLARLGTPTHLVAPIGRDDHGDQLIAHTRAAGVVMDHVVLADDPTGTYLAVLGPDGELVVAVASMSITDHLTVGRLTGCRDLLAGSDLLVLDGNVPPDTAAWILDLAAATSTPVVMDPVSVAKAAGLVPVLGPERPLHALTPNVDELAAMVGRTVPGTGAGIARAATELHDLGVRHVWVRRGPRGSLLSSVDEDGAVSATELEAPPGEVVDVTGAGDAMTAALVHALLRGDPPPEAARFGQMAAALTVASPETVRTDLTPRLIDVELRRAKETR